MRDLVKAFRYFKKNGIRTTAAKISETKRYREAAAAYMEENTLSEEELDYQKSRSFVRGPVFSVIVPMYNSKEDYLRELIESVISQTYDRWELILIDGSSLTYKIGENTAMEYVLDDNRVKYRRLGGNLGISGNTNHGVDACIGEYLVFADHDDILMPDALYRVAEAIRETDADFLYSDEFNFSESPQNVLAVTLKPEFSEYTLRGINYIGHMCVVKKSLFRKVGGLRSDFDGSQDYDLVLRLGDKAKKIIRLPYVLYGWRVHQGSVAQGIEAKTYCLDRAKAAIREHLNNRKIHAEISDIKGAESAYRLKYPYPHISLSVVVCMEGGERFENSYIKNLIENIGEKEVEIIIVGGYNSFEGITSIEYSGAYHFTHMANIGAMAAGGDVIMFLDSRITPRKGFLEELLPYAAFEDVGCVGGGLINKAGRVEAMGYLLDSEEAILPWLKGSDIRGVGYLRSLKIPRNVSCLTGGFLMVKKKDFLMVGGFSERLGVTAGGCDLCLKLSNRGNIVVTPYALGVINGDIDEDFEDFYGMYEENCREGDPYLRMP